MAMRIIKRIDYSDWRRRFTCSKCGSELEAEPGDVFAQYHGGYSDMREASLARYTYHCACIVCGERHNIPKDDVPQPMRYALQDKASNNRCIIPDW